VLLSSAEYFFPVVLVIGITAISLGVAKKQKLWLSIWCYYVITLIPVLGIIQVGGQLMADRYTYLPGLGPFLIMGLAVVLVWEKVHATKKWYLVFKLFCVALFACMTFLTFTQIGIWKSDIDLWSSAIEKGTPTDTFSRMKRGLAYKERGQFDKAIADFGAIIALEPFRAEVFYNRGLAFDTTGQIDKAIEDYNAVIALNPAYMEAHIRLGVLFGKSGSLDKAIEQFNKAINLNRDYSPAYNNRGYAYSLVGQNSKALEDFNKAIELDKNYMGAYMNRGNVYLKTGNKELAVSDFQKACDLGDQGACNALKQNAK
jgi:lipoprotein NlpI